MAIQKQIKQLQQQQIGQLTSIKNQLQGAASNMLSGSG